MIPFPRRALLHALALLALAGCASTPARPPNDTERDALAAAADGRFDSALRVARMYQAWNDPRALDWYARAAATTPRTHHSTNAEETLGTLYARGRLDSGEGPQKPADVVMKASPRKAFRWFQSAAYHGSPYAMHDLERWYEGRGDMTGALRWRLRSAVYLRELYKLKPLREATSGSAPHGQPIDTGPAPNPVIAGIQRRAARGDAEAQVDLGALHEAGIGVVQDKAEALRWYERAGRQGNVYGQYLAGLAVGRGGDGLAKDVDAAAAWFALAEAQGFYMAAESYWREAIAPPFWTFE
ncbi:tetratricopeptide repeat protein [Stenotrophomonas sp. NPDC078853]|uniref:tetratricopeptide repeat protein n=1 Tax=Stenotrophomonas sp. NPDC078853 TaxID=3364534 RepID=UPI00384D1739